MALVRRFQETKGTAVRWRTEVDCGYTVTSFAGRRVLHLETYGSSDRAVPGKVSQSLEFDEDRAREFIEILRRAFP